MENSNKKTVRFKKTKQDNFEFILGLEKLIFSYSKSQTSNSHRLETIKTISKVIFFIQMSKSDF